jgi:hypothetical protein
MKPFNKNLTFAFIKRNWKSWLYALLKMLLAILVVCITYVLFAYIPTHVIMYGFAGHLFMIGTVFILLHFIVKFLKKKEAHWTYSWIISGGFIVSLVFILIYSTPQTDCPSCRLNTPTLVIIKNAQGEYASQRYRVFKKLQGENVHYIDFVEKIPFAKDVVNNEYTTYLYKVNGDIEVVYHEKEAHILYGSDPHKRLVLIQKVELLLQTQLEEKLRSCVQDARINLSVTNLPKEVAVAEFVGNMEFTIH